MSTSTNVEECSVNWSSHSNHWKQVFDRMLVANDFVDATIYCDGRKLHVHKVVLSAFSTYFYEVFKDITCEQPVIILKGIDYDVLYALVQFMYRGEVNLERTKLNTFLKAAEFLQVCGLKMVAPESTSSTSHIASNKDALNTTTATTTTSSSSCGSGNRASAEETTSVVPSSVPTDFTAEDTSSSGDTAKDSSPRKKRQKISANESQSEKSSTSRAASEIQDTAESIQIKCEPEDEAVSVDEFYETIKSKQSVITPARHSDPLSSTDQGHTSDGNNMLNLVLRNQDDMKALLSQIHEIVFQQTVIGGSTSSNSSNRCYLIPEGVNAWTAVTNEEELIELDRKLANQTTLLKAIENLRVLGGKDVAVGTRKILSVLMANDLAKNCNWSGRNDKIPFAKMENINKLIFGAVQRNPMLANVTKCEVEKQVKMWLRNAFDREGGRIRRNLTSTTEKDAMDETKDITDL